MNTVTLRVPDSAGTLYERIQYPAGELQVRLMPATVKALYAANKIQVLCRNAHLNLMELVLLSNAIHGLAGFTETELILPYLPYGRADRRFTEGDCHGLGAFGRIVDGLGFHSVKTLDAHSFRAPKNVGNLVDVSATSFIARAISDIVKWNKEGDLAILLPDEGAKRYELEGPVLQCTKKRDAKTGQLSGFTVPDFKQPSALIVDDICDGGGTFVGLAQEIHKRYYNECTCSDLPHLMGRDEHANDCGILDAIRTKLYLYVTHGIFSKGLGALTPWFDRVYTTSSIYPFSPLLFSSPKLEVYDCEPLLLS